MNFDSLGRFSRLVPVRVAACLFAILLTYVLAAYVLTARVWGTTGDIQPDLLQALAELHVSKMARTDVLIGFARLYVDGMFWVLLLRSVIGERWIIVSLSVLHGVSGEATLMCVCRSMC